MRRTVKDYEIAKSTGLQQVETFKGAQPLRVEAVGGRVFLAMEVDLDRPPADMTFSVHESGEVIETRPGYFPPTYVGTADSATTYHLYHHAPRS